MRAKSGLLLGFFVLAAMGWSQAKPGDVVQDGPDAQNSTRIEAVTYSEIPGAVFLLLREFADKVGWEVAYDATAEATTLNGHPLEDKAIRQLWAGTPIFEISELKGMGVQIKKKGASGYSLDIEGRTYEVVIPEKFVEVSIAHQQIRAWQGSHVVMKTACCTGMPGHLTPIGKFRTGPIKVPMKYSSKYESAPMPWSTQVSGDYFAHGSNSVPGHPASHGCIRLPLTGKNAARYFYTWVDQNVRFSIATDWSEQAKELTASAVTELVGTARL